MKKNKTNLEVGKYYQLKGHGNTALVKYAGMDEDKYKFHPYVNWGIPNEACERITLTTQEINRYVYPAK